MTRSYQNFTGQRIGYLTIIKRISTPEGYRDGVVYWLALCDCGKEKVTTSWAIRERQNRLSCGCKRYHEGQPKNRRYDNPQDPTWNAIINSYKQRCRRDAILWELSRERAIELFCGDCVYCGIPPFVCKNVYKTKQNLERDSATIQQWRERASVLYNGIDRLDSNAHYSDRNVASCCKICNYAKRDLTLEEFTTWLNRIKEIPNG